MTVDVSAAVRDKRAREDIWPYGGAQEEEEKCGNFSAHLVNFHYDLRKQVKVSLTSHWKDEIFPAFPLCYFCAQISGVGPGYTQHVT